MTTAIDRRLTRIEQSLGSRVCECRGYVVVPGGAASWEERQAVAVATVPRCPMHGHPPLVVVPAKERSNG